MKRFTFFALFLLSSLSFQSLAGDDGVARLTKALAVSMPQVKPTSITESPIKGLYQVVVGSQVVYMSDDARYMLEGEFYDLKEKVSLSENAKSAYRLETLNKISDDEMVIYKPEKVDTTITVVTDIDCPFCRRLHNEIPDYMENNIQVRYIFMPLKGAADMKKTISVWCSDDQQTSLDIAKAGGDVEEKSCDNPIRKHLKLARELGVRGTPAIFLESGEMLPGYVPYDKLLVQMQK